MTDRAAPRPPFRSIAGIAAAVLTLFMLGNLATAGTAGAKQASKPRIVSISPFGTDALARLGVKPIAIGQVLSEKNRTPAKFRGVKVLPLSHPNGPNLETLAKIRPTLVISSTRWSRGTPAMKRLGIRVIYADPVNVSQAYRSVLTVGRAVKRPSQARRLRSTMIRQVNAARGSKLGIRVMGILGVGRNPQTFLANSWGGQMISLAGGTLMTGGAHSSGGFAPISDEVVVAEQPQVIIGVPHGTVTDIGKAFGYILENPAWQNVPAIKNHKVRGSFDNRLLQAGTDIGATIRIIRRCIVKKPTCD